MVTTNKGTQKNSHISVSFTDMNLKMCVVVAESAPPCARYLVETLGINVDVNPVCLAKYLLHH